MPTLREVRQRISGVKTTQKITKAMKMVAAAKLRRAQTGIISARPYARSLRTLLQHLLSTEENSVDEKYLPREVRAVGLVVVTSDRGLCGAFNSNIIKTTINHAETQYAALRAAGNVKLFCIGRKGVDFFAKQNFPIIGRHSGVFGHLTFAEAYKIALEIVQSYQRGEIDRVEVIYNEFKSIVRQQILIEQYLPFEPAKAESEGEAKLAQSGVNYIYEPSRKAILDALVPQYLHFELWRVLLESNASEQGARMTAMENATENANELIETLQLQYNKARQAAITKELLEIVSGAEALRG